MPRDFDLIQSVDGQTKEDFLFILKEMYFKSPSIYELIKRFKLHWACHPLDEKMTTEDILSYLDNININQNQNKQQMKKAQNTNTVTATGTTNDPFANLKPIEQTGEFESFLNFENPGDEVKGFLVGTTMISPAKDQPKTKRYLILDTDTNEVGCLPNNQQLMNKLDFIASTVGGTLSKENKKAVIITFNEEIPHPTKEGQTIKKFTVLG